jgi:DNA (cytosine-5)-methyltransferase 1
MRYLSLFSGIEAASVAWHPLGWECVAVSEIEPFPCAVLAHHYPTAPNLGDVTMITEADIAALGPIDIVVFGSPCQDLSVAGQRKGLINEHGDITRSGLFFAAINIFHWAREHCGARFALWENVPGAFSSSQSRDFASVVSFMAGIDSVDVPKNGWGTEGAAVGDNGLLEWAVLDAQWFGVAQRRRRVFALLDTGDWANRPPILLESKSLRGDSPPSREAGQTVAPTIAGCANGGGANGPGRDVDSVESLVVQPFVVANTLTQRMHKGINTTLDEGQTPVVMAYEHHMQDSRIKPLNDVFPQLNAKAGTGGGNLPLVMSNDTATSICANEQRTYTSEGSVFRLRNVVGNTIQVRRLTPIECERLQGFPDGYTDIRPKGKPTPDGPRYKALGNSMAVPVMRWIGRKIDFLRFV